MSQLADAAIHQIVREFSMKNDVDPNYFSNNIKHFKLMFESDAKLWSNYEAARYNYSYTCRNAQITSAKAISVASLALCQSNQALAATILTDI